MNGDPVTIRVLDWGGEKDIEALSNAGIVPDISDMNPAMGLRGVRLLLRRPDCSRRNSPRSCGPRPTGRCGFCCQW